MELKKRNVPFSPPDMSEAEIQEVAETLRSGWITTGPKTKMFESKLAQFLTTERVACLNSATAAMEMALRLIDVGPEDEVIVPAYTYTASASVTQHVGCKLVLVDSQPNCVEMDYEKLAEAITEHTKVICPVDLGGVVCDYDKVFQVVEAKKGLFRPSNELQKRIGRIIVAADCAHALGAKWHGKMAGTIADFSSFSFHAVKNLTTAEGGAITWNLPFGYEQVQYDKWSTVPHIEGETWNDFLYRLCQLYSLHGQNKDALAKTQLGSWEYDVIGPWYKCNMTDIMAGIGLAQLRRYPEMLKRRREIIEKYNEALKDLPVAVLDHFGPDYAASGHLYITRLMGCSDQERRDIIVEMAKRGIACNVHYKPLPMMTAYKDLGFDIKDFPNAYHLYENEITLPLHAKLSDEDVDYVITNYVDIISEYFAKHSKEKENYSCANCSVSNIDEQVIANRPRKDRILMCLAHMSGRERLFIKDAFISNWVVPLGPNVDGFESDLKNFTTKLPDGSVISNCSKEVAALCSGTAAVHLALLSAGIGPGDEVIVQSFTFCASSNPVTYVGANPVFVDSEPDSWNMDPDLLVKAIEDRIKVTGKKPKAIIPVSLYGMPYRIDEIMKIASDYDIPVIEDAAEGFGSRFDGQVLGTFGKYGVLSFNGNKMITTSGGGALICSSMEDKKKILWYASQAREAYPYYQHETIGYNYRLSNICAGIGRGQMTIADEHIAHHKRVYELYKELLAFVPGISVHGNPSPRYDSNFWLNTITIDPNIKIKGQDNAYSSVVKGAIGGAGGVVHASESAHTDCEPNSNVEALRIVLDAARIESRPLWKPMHKQPIYKGYPAYLRPCNLFGVPEQSVSEALFKVGLCLPSGPYVKDDDVRYIVDTIKGAIL